MKRKIKTNEPSAMAVAMIDKYPWTADTIAEELEMPVQYFRVWKNKMERDGKLSKPAVPSILCIQDPNSKNRLLYSDSYLEKVRELRAGSPKRNTGKIHASSLKHAILTIEVPVFDQNVASFLIKKFGNERGIQSHLKDHIKDISSTTLSKIEALRRRHEQELQEALAEF